MALAWKAGWVQALAGSNPASSARLKQALTCGNAVRIRSAAREASHQTSRRPVSIPVSASALRLPESGIPRSGRVRRRAPRLTNPLRKRALFSPIAEAGPIGGSRGSDRGLIDRHDSAIRSQSAQNALGSILFASSLRDLRAERCRSRLTMNHPKRFAAPSQRPWRPQVFEVGVVD